MTEKEFCEWLNNYLNIHCPSGNYRGLNPLDIENIRAELDKTINKENKNAISGLSQ